MLPERQSPPGGTVRGAKNVVADDIHTVAHRPDMLADLDALAEHLRGYLVLQVTVDDAGSKRTVVYRSAAAAQRAVERARDRGRMAHVSLCQLVPIGVIHGLGGGR